MRNPAESVRIGHGYDLHRLEPRPPAGQGRALVVGGVGLDFDRGPIAHSDGDALLHAVTDALLAAAGMPDIGQLFPDNDPAHHSRDSREFLRAAADRVRGAGWIIANIDATVILEKPKVSPHKDAMRSNIAAALDIDVSRVGVKGKTHERVDAVGESRAIEVHAVALLVRD
ncbi:MAG: 2-C-methyl-D-erythritol 2,4-cyclodiphosphate synthase [Phycisphaerales bacterium]|nr:2-C-methyl-D-erythritol 2,4-cyclodiphosphate synthase [Planctomycetota bacterium]